MYLDIYGFLSNTCYDKISYRFIFIFSTFLKKKCQVQMVEILSFLQQLDMTTEFDFGKHIAVSATALFSIQTLYPLFVY